MTVDAGTAQIAHQYGHAPRGPAAELSADLGLDVMLGRLVARLERDETRQAAELQRLAQSCAPIDIPPLDFTVAANQPAFKAMRATAADASPQEGFMWFVTRLTLAGLGNGDVLNLHRTASGVITGLSTAVHAFGPGTAALSVFDWEPGIAGCMMRPDDTFYLRAGSATLAATELVLTGQAIQVAAPYIGKFLM